MFGVNCVPFDRYRSQFGFKIWFARGTILSDRWDLSLLQDNLWIGNSACAESSKERGQWGVHFLESRDWRHWALSFELWLLVSVWMLSRRGEWCDVSECLWFGSRYGYQTQIYRLISRYICEVCLEHVCDVSFVVLHSHVLGITSSASLWSTREIAKICPIYFAPRPQHRSLGVTGCFRDCILL